MHFNFVVDRMIQGRAYPALAQWSAEPYTPEWHQFGQHWPYTVPPHLYDFCVSQNIPHSFYTIDSFPPDSYYTIGLQFFDFSIDYFVLISSKVLTHIRKNQLRVLFFYDEGDNPHLIKKRLDELCVQHNLPSDCYRFISANTAASMLPSFVYLLSDELLYWQQNRNVGATVIHTDTRSQEFTVLSRTHKCWRATVMADLKRQGLLDNSFWSYNTNVGLNETSDDNSLNIVSQILKSDIENFLAQGPYVCDDFTSDQHNDHSLTNHIHFSDSYCSIILETHFDADNSNGTFLTEKTFKAIKHGHPFVIVGCVGSLEELKSQGYRTFDHAIDNSYDLETDSVQRWIKIVSAIRKIQQQNMHDWFLQCLDDVRHNQQVFLQSKKDRLTQLYRKLND